MVWQDDRPDLERTARYLGDKLSGDSREVVLAKASTITIPDILAASSYLFGADEAGNESYREVVRLLRGVNLAGRPVAFFGTNGAALSWLREMTKDAELSPVSADLIGARPEQSAVSSLLKAFS